MIIEKFVKDRFDTNTYEKIYSDDMVIIGKYSFFDSMEMLGKKYDVEGTIIATISFIHAGKVIINGSCLYLTPKKGKKDETITLYGEERTSQFIKNKADFIKDSEELLQLSIFDDIIV